MWTGAKSWPLEAKDFENLLEVSTVLFGIFDLQGQIQFLNPAWQKSLGHSCEEILAMGLEDLIHPSDLSHWQKTIHQFADSQPISNFENRFRHRDGSWRYFHWIVTRVPGRNMICAQVCDVTEQKQQQLEKENADRLLKYTVNSLPILVAYMDTQFEYQFMNSSYRQWVGEQAENIKSGKLEEAVGRESAQALWSHREEAFRTGKPNRFEITFVDVKGEKRFLEVRYHPHCKANGEVEGLMVLGFDVTELKRAYASLRSTEFKLQQVLNDGNVGYWELDLATGLVTTSENVRERMGLPKEPQLTRESLAAKVHPEDRQKLFEASSKVIAQGLSSDIELRFCREDGSCLWVFFTMHAVYNEAGERIGLMGISADITERKLMEQTLQAQRAQMMTSARLSAIGEMASGVAHEINNPLAIITLNVERMRILSRHGNLDSGAVSVVADKIDSTVMRISRIIQSLRSLSRDGERDAFEPVSLKKIIDDALEICKQRFINHSVDLRLKCHSLDISLYARSTQLSQVLLNLLNNAHDAVENRSERWVELEVQDKGEFVEITVTDSGQGIPSETLEKIFNPFFTTKDPSKGTGLGLSVSRNIVLDHGGTLKVNPQAEHTQFVLQLPKKMQR